MTSVTNATSSTAPTSARSASAHGETTTPRTAGTVAAAGSAVREERRAFDGGLVAGCVVRAAVGALDPVDTSCAALLAAESFDDGLEFQRDVLIVVQSVRG